MCSSDGKAYGACTSCGSPSDGGNVDQGASKKRVFVTSQHYDGNLGGSAGGDAKCNAVAQAAISAGLLKGAGTTWVAWLSDSTSNAIDRLVDVGPWYLVDEQTKVFNNKAHVALQPAQLLGSGITMDERGNDAISQCAVSWTGTMPGGTVSAADCADWTSNASNVNGTEGVPGATDDNWTDFSGSVYCGAIPDTEACNYTGHALICFEQ